MKRSSFYSAPFFILESLEIGGLHAICDFGFGSMELRNFYLCKKKMRLPEFGVIGVWGKKPEKLPGP